MCYCVFTHKVGVKESIINAAAFFLICPLGYSYKTFTEWIFISDLQYNKYCPHVKWRSPDVSCCPVTSCCSLQASLTCSTSSFSHEDRLMQRWLRPGNTLITPAEISFFFISEKMQTNSLSNSLLLIKLLSFLLSLWWCCSILPCNSM